MRTVIFTPRAVNAIDAVCAFIESQNTPGSSVKWYHNLVSFLIDYADLSVLKFPLCNHRKLAAKGFCCFIYRKQWIVVFKYTDTSLTVYRFLNGSRLK